MPTQDAFGGSVLELTAKLRPQIDRLEEKIVIGQAEDVIEELNRILEQLEGAPDDDRQVAQLYFDALYVGFQALLWLGRCNELMEVADQLVKIADDTKDPLLITKSMIAKTKTYRWLGYYEKARVFILTVEDVSRRLGFQKELAESLLEKSFYANSVRLLDEVLPLRLEAVSLAKESGDETLYADCLYFLGALYVKNQQPDEADQTLKEALDLYKKTGNNRGICRVFRQIIDVIPLDQKDTRLEFLQKALSLAEESHDPVERAMVYSAAGWEWMDTDKDLSLEYFQKELSLYHELEDQVGLKDCYTEIGGYYYYHSENEKSREYHKKSLEIAEKLEDHFSASNSYLFLGNTYFDEDNFRDALDHFNQSAEQLVIPKKGKKGDLVERILWMARCLALLDDSEKAEEYFNTVVQAYTEREEWGPLANAFADMGRTFRRQRDFKRATDYLLKSIDAFHKAEDVEGLLSSYNEMVGIGFEEPNYPLAIRILDILIKMNDELDRQPTLAENYKDRAAGHFNLEAYEPAVEDYVKALNIFLALKNNDQAGRTYADLAETVLKLDRHDDALGFYAEALSISKQEKMLDLRALVYEGMADVYYATDNYKDAAKQYLKAKAAYDVGFEDGLLDLTEEELNEIGGRCYRKAASSAWLNDWDGDAVFLYKKALKAYKKVGDDLQIAEVNHRLGDVLADNSDSYQEALDCYSKALHYYETYEKEKLTEAELYEGMGNLHLELGDTRRAEMELQTALDYYYNEGEEEAVARVQEILEELE
ncbi:MAG: tetratricopeptide repeat protein [Bacteroidales bacterium]|nr:tetratricopeptide repeat protein [Bacteroidales bacterium]